MSHLMRPSMPISMRYPHEEGYCKWSYEGFSIIIFLRYSSITGYGLWWLPNRPQNSRNLTMLICGSCQRVDGMGGAHSKLFLTFVIHNSVSTENGSNQSKKSYTGFFHRYCFHFEVSFTKSGSRHLQKDNAFVKFETLTFSTIKEIC